ncbi:poly(3-hydroxyalkanoate) depolymerase [Parvibaculum sp.]|mgnify:CR=1 FL=1|jgi:poly(3-hydroxyalkanoate) depolymerase|uniref:poly(3-hydroxyalkanoate) depolymerase n=1 Tax=Parvibaculum sp. TaxID=2024848 RepID=UPI002FDB46C2
MNSGKPRYRDIRVGSNILRTAVWEGKGPHRPLLFFNGIGANIELIAPLAEEFTDRDVIAFDAPGVGGSPSAAFPYRPWQFARMAAGILDELGYGEVDVMGVSWGGAMAQQFAFQFGSRVHRLILAATSAGFFMVPGKPAALAKLAHPKRYMNPAYMLEHFEMLYGDEADGADGHAKRLRAPSFRGYFYQLLAGMGWTSVPFLPFLKPQTLILAGENDQIVPHVNGRFLASLIPGARLEIVPGGHLFLVSRAKEVLPLIRGFLDEAPARRPFVNSDPSAERRFRSTRRGSGEARPAV